MRWAEEIMREIDRTQLFWWQLLGFCRIPEGVANHVHWIAEFIDNAVDRGYRLPAYPTRFYGFRRGKSGHDSWWLTMPGELVAFRV
jgi:hypothetical protein